MSAAKFKTNLTRLAFAGLVIAVVLQYRSSERDRAELAALRGELAAARSAPGVVPPDASDVAWLRTGREELTRLRGEVARLRQSQSELTRLSAENQQLRTAATGAAAEAEQEAQRAFKETGIARMNYARNWGLAFLLFAQENTGRMPRTFAEAEKFLPKEAAALLAAPDRPQLEIVFNGLLADIADPARVLLLRETDSFTDPNGTALYRTYLFADGHSEIHSAADGDFTAWEQEHLAPAAVSIPAPTAAP